MSTQHDSEIIKALYDLCDGDMDLIRQKYKIIHGKKITKRAIKKIISSVSSQPLQQLDADLHYEELIMDDDPIKIKKEEITEDDIYNEESIAGEETEEHNQDDFRLDTNLAACPIVYTTRLENMKIFKKDLKSIPLSNVVNQLVNESKPKFTDPIIKTEPFENDSLTFDELIDKIEQFNVIATTNTVTTTNTNSTTNTIENLEETNDTPFIKTEPEDLLSNQLELKTEILCKQAYVVLHDCKSALRINRCPIHKHFRLGVAIMKCGDCTKTFKVLGSKQVVAPILPKITSFGRIQNLSHRHVNLWVVMKNLHLNTTELYNTRSDLGNIPTDYYLIDRVICKDEELAHYISSDNKILEFFNCCWYKRDENIQKVWPTYYANRAPYFFMKAHSCPNNKCNCCCNKESTGKSQLSESETTGPIEESSAKRNSDWKQFLSNANGGNTSSWINKVLDYRRTPKPKLVTHVKENYSPRTDVHFNYCSYVYHYVIGEDDVDCFFKIVRRNELPTLDVIPLKLKSCCWVQLQTSMRVFLTFTTPDNINFLKMPHHCDIGNCNCCCKTNNRIDLKPIEPPNMFIHTKKCTAKFNEKLKNVDVEFQTNTVNQCQAQCLRVKSNQQIIKEPRRVGGRIPLGVVPVALSQTDCNQQSTNLSAASDVIPTTQISSPVSINPQDDPTVNTLIATILDRFKNIRLTLGPGGKVMAKLDTPVSELSNDELKILSNILAHAQEQVKTLGIASPSNIEPNTPVVNPPAQENLVKIMPQNPLGYSFPITVPTDPPPLTFKTTNENLSNTPSDAAQKAQFQDARKRLIETINHSSDLYDTYTKITYIKNEEYRRSIEAYSKFFSVPVKIPKIQNTFSLKDQSTLVNQTNEALMKQQSQKPVGKRKSDNSTMLEEALKAKKARQSPNITVRNFQSQQSPLLGQPTSTITQQGIPQRGIPQLSIPQQGISRLSIPQQGIPQLSIPEQGVPPLVPSNAPLMSPMFFVQNPTNNLHMPPRISTVTGTMNGGFMKPIIVPNTLTNGQISGVPAMANNTYMIAKPPVPSAPFNAINTAPNHTIPNATDKSDDDCILGV